MGSTTPDKLAPRKTYVLTCASEGDFRKHRSLTDPRSLRKMFPNEADRCDRDPEAQQLRNLPFNRNT